MHLHRKLLAGGLLAILLASTSPVAAALQASVDRAEILPGETITLTLEQDDPTAVAEPDLRQLEENFQILDVRRSQHVTIVNGDRSESSSWVVVLLPNDANVTRIPPEWAECGSRWHRWARAQRPSYCFQTGRR